MTLHKFLYFIVCNFLGKIMKCFPDAFSSVVLLLDRFYPRLLCYLNHSPEGRDEFMLFPKPFLWMWMHETGSEFYFSCQYSYTTRTYFIFKVRWHRYLNLLSHFSFFSKTILKISFLCFKTILSIIKISELYGCYPCTSFWIGSISS